MALQMTFELFPLVVAQILHTSQRAVKRVNKSHPNIRSTNEIVPHNYH